MPERLLITKLMLQAGASPAVADADGQTPLHHALFIGSSATAMILLDAGAPLHVRNVGGRNPLHVWHASEKEFSQVLNDRLRADEDFPAASQSVDDMGNVPKLPG